MKPHAERWLVIGTQIGIILAFLALWELLIRFGTIKEFFFGQPSRIIAYLYEQTLSGYLVRHTWVTLYEELLGFVLGTAIGTAIGLALWWSPYLSRVLEPYAVMLNATPKIVIAPILIVWFGIGLTSKVMIAVLICSIVAWLGAFEGVRNADADQMDMLRAVGGKERHVFFKIVAPASLPWLISTARINIGLALIGVITGEFLSSTEGLGYLVEQTARVYKMSETLGALTLIAAMAAAQLYLLNWIEARLFQWAYEPEHRGEYIT